MNIQFIFCIFNDAFTAYDQYLFLPIQDRCHQALLTELKRHIKCFNFFMIHFVQVA